MDHVRRLEHRVKALKILFFRFLSFLTFRFVVVKQKASKTHLNGLPDKTLSTNQNIAVATASLDVQSCQSRLDDASVIKRQKMKVVFTRSSDS